MTLYLSIIFIGMAIASGLGVAYFSAYAGTHEWWVIVTMVVATSLALFLCDLIFAGSIKLLPQKWFDPYKKKYKISKREKSFYELLGINYWKDKVPEVGKLVGYDKTSVGDLTADNLFKFLTESAYGEIIHYFCLLSSVIIAVIYFFIPIDAINGLFWGVVLPCALVNFFLNVPPILIQRYNRPRLMRIHQLLVKKEQKAADAISQDSEVVLL